MGHLSWKNFNAFGVVAACLLWAVAEPLGWVHSVVLVNRLSFAALIVAFIAAWRSDVPTDQKVQKKGSRNDE